MAEDTAEANADIAAMSFEDALADFRVRVSAAAPDVDAIVWHDENVLIHARRDHD